MAKRQPKPKRADSRRGPGSRNAKDKNKERKQAPKVREVPSWVETCLKNVDPDLAAIYKTLPTDPNEMFAFMQKVLAAKGIWMDLAYLEGRVPDMQTVIREQRDLFVASGQLLRLSRDAMGTSEFDAVEGYMLPEGEFEDVMDADGRVQLRLIQGDD